MRLLVTGGVGFIESNFIKHMLGRYDYQLINLKLSAVCVLIG
jgi:dTDP-glucose 4,6-dehydratase